MMIPSDHPPTCQTCHGSGWQTGPDNIIRHRDGHILRTTATVVPCTHHWSDDDPDDVISLDDYLARHPDAALEASRAHHPTAHT